jgi:unsaturated chondroitin disaccharide hydrolase
LTADGDRARRYRDATLAILTKLCSPEFLAVEEPAWEGILRHGVYHERRGLGVDESVMWGDYFFVEALDRVLESTRVGRP